MSDCWLGTVRIWNAIIAGSTLRLLVFWLILPVILVQRLRKISNSDPHS